MRKSVRNNDKVCQSSKRMLKEALQSFEPDIYLQKNVQRALPNCLIVPRIKKVWKY